MPFLLRTEVLLLFAALTVLAVLRLRHLLLRSDPVGKVASHRTLQEVLPPLKSVEVQAHLNTAQEARLSQLSGRLILMIGAGSSPEKRTILDKAKQLGVRAVVLDGPESWATSLVADGTIAGLYHVAFESDSDSTLSAMLAVVDRVRLEHGEISGVCTFFERMLPGLEPQLLDSHTLNPMTGDGIPVR